MQTPLKADEISAPIFINMYAPKVDDIPNGAALRPGAMIVEISTPPVFGERRDESRFFRFPVYPVGRFKEPSAENTRAAFGYLMATSECARQAVDQLAALVRNERARTSAATHLRKFKSRRVRQYAAG